MKRNYSFKPRKGIASNPFMRGNDFLAELKTKPTLSDKRSYVAEHNPLLLVFGTNLNPRNPYERSN
jgi:hypothetical protein